MKTKMAVLIPALVSFSLGFTNIACGQAPPPIGGPPPGGMTASSVTASASLSGALVLPALTDVSWVGEGDFAITAAAGQSFNYSYNVTVERYAPSFPMWVPFGLNTGQGVINAPPSQAFNVTKNLTVSGTAARGMYKTTAGVFAPPLSDTASIIQTF